MKKQHFYFVLGFLVFLSILYPNGIPFFIFLAIVSFTFNDKGKNIFDLKKWEDSPPQIYFEKSSRKNNKKLDESEEEESSKNKPEKKNNFSSIPFIHNLMNNKKLPYQSSGFTPSLLLVGIVGIIIVSVISDGFVSIPAGSTGVVFDKLSNEVKEETLNSGISFKIPFFQEVTIVNTRIQEETINDTRDPIKALTKDGQNVNVEVTAQYFIAKENASKLYEQVGMDYQSKVVKAGVRSIVRDVITGYDSTELFNQEFRQKAQQEMKAMLSENYAEKYISLEDILIRDVTCSEVYLKAIEEKKVAEQDIQKEGFRKQESEVRKERTIIEAQAEAEALRLKGEALSAHPEMIQLQFVEKMASDINWGILPDGAVPLINPENLQKK